MKSIFLQILSALLLLPFLTGCSDNKPAPPDEQPAPRTVLVYMIANNNLGYPYEWAQYDLKDIAEMEQSARSGAFGKSRLIVFRHAYVSPGKSEMKLLEVTREGTRELKTYTDMASSASEETMNRVIADAKALAPANRYGIVLWSHASGWINTGIDTPKATPRSYGYDGTADKAMSVTSLANVLNGKGFDFIYFDCCFMAGVEVAYELRDASTWMVASAAELPVNGTPYHLALPYLMPADADPVAAAKATFSHYSDRYDPSAAFDEDPDAFGCTFSAIYLPKMENLAKCVKEIYDEDLTRTSIGNIQQFAPQTDLWYYCDLDGVISSFEGLNASSYNLFTNTLHETVQASGATPGLFLQNSFTINSHCGLTTYLPRNEADIDRDNYRKLAWYRDVASYLKF